MIDRQRLLADLKPFLRELEVDLRARCDEVTEVGERLTQAHHGHLYQLAHRAGMDARLVAALHWGFAALGGLACLGFLAAPSALKPFLPLALLLPQLAWTLYVAARARRAAIGRW